MIRAWQRLSPLTRGLTIFALCNVVLVSGLLVLLPAAGWRDIAPYHTTRFLALKDLDDSWHPIAQAWTFLQEDHDALVYDAIFFDDNVKFQYALTTLLPMEFLQLFRDDEAVTEFAPFTLISWALVWMNALFVALILLKSTAQYAPHLCESRTDRFALSAIAVALTLTFYPIVKSFSLGQIQTWINCLFAFSMWLWMTNRRGASGLVGGLICAIKPQLGLLLIWGLLRRHHSFALAFASTFGLIVLATVLLYGIENNLNYLDVLSYISRRGETYYPNQSANGLLNRLLGNGNNTDFEATAFPPFDPIVYAGTIASSLVIVGAALFWRARDVLPGSAIDFALVSLSFTIASPIAWEHHYGVLMPMYALALPALIRFPVLGRWSVPALAGSYVLVSNFFNIAQKVAGHELLTPLQSYLLFGALLLLVLLYMLRRAEYQSSQGYEHPSNSNAPTVRGSTIS